MKRTYLEEDLYLIQKYFPGAKTVALHTPFDLTQRPAYVPRLTTDNFQDTATERSTWHGGILWMN